MPPVARRRRLRLDAWRRSPGTRSHRRLDGPLLGLRRRPAEDGTAPGQRRAPGRSHPRATTERPPAAGRQPPRPGGWSRSGEREHPRSSSRSHGSEPPEYVRWRVWPWPRLGAACAGLSGPRAARCYVAARLGHRSPAGWPGVWPVHPTEGTPGGHAVRRLPERDLPAGLDRGGAGPAGAPGRPGASGFRADGPRSAGLCQRRRRRRGHRPGEPGGLRPVADHPADAARHHRTRPAHHLAWQRAPRTCAAKQGGAQVAFGDAAQHPRDDPPPVEGLPVRPDGVLAAGAAVDIAQRTEAHPLGSHSLQVVQAHRLGRHHPGQALQVDLILVVAVLHGRQASLRSGGPARHRASRPVTGVPTGRQRSTAPPEDRSGRRRLRPVGAMATPASGHTLAARYRDSVTTIGDVRALLTGTSLPAEVADGLLQEASPWWLGGASAQVLAADLELCHPPLADGEVRVVARPTFDENVYRLTVVSRFHPGLLAAMAATMAAEGLLVVKAVTTSWTAGQLVLTGANVMHPDGPMQPADWDRVSAAMRQAASGGDEPRVAFKPRQPVTVDVFPREEGQALLEVRAPHRIGLLWATCSWLAEHGCTVNAAFIEASGLSLIHISEPTRLLSI